jgi:phytanoyl-CoA hydroxylase
MSDILSESQVAAYEPDGFLVIPDVTSPADVAALQAVTNELVERSRSASDHMEVFDLEPVHTAEKALLRRLTSPEKWYPTYVRMVRHPKILGALQDLWRTGVRCQTSKLNMQVAGYGFSLEWPRDWAFYLHTNEVLAVVAS